MKVKISSSEKNMIDLISKKYDESQLLEITRFNGSIDELNKQYPIECLREVSDKYRVIYLGEDNVVVVEFDNFGNRLSGKSHKTEHLLSEFKMLLKGESLEKVRIIDPHGEYLFLYTGRNDTPRISSHYTKDGYLITIEYDDSNLITKIKEELL